MMTSKQKGRELERKSRQEYQVIGPQDKIFEDLEVFEAS